MPRKDADACSEEKECDWSGFARVGMAAFACLLAGCGICFFVHLYWRCLHCNTPAKPCGFDFVEQVGPQAGLDKLIVCLVPALFLAGIKTFLLGLYILLAPLTVPPSLIYWLSL